MGELLDAASLLFAVIGILYGAWYSEIAAAIAVPIKTHRLDRDPEIEQVKETKWQRAYPLSAASVLVAAIILPPAIGITYGSFQHVRHVGVSAFKDYNPVQAGVVLVAVFSVALAISIGKSSWRLYDVERKLKT